MADEVLGPQKEIGQQGDNADADDYHHHQPDVVVFDVGKLMGNYPFQLFIGQLVNRPGGYGDGSQFRLPAGGKSVDVGIFNQMNFGHRQPGGNAEIFNHPADIGIVGLLGSSGAGRGQGGLVAFEIAEEVQNNGQEYHQNQKAIAQLVAFGQNPGQAGNDNQKNNH